MAQNMKKQIYMWPSYWGKPVAHGSMGAVSCNNIYSSRAGLEILNKGGNAFGFLAIILQSAYCQRETCYTCVGELTDFCILSYETGYYEIVFNLFHNELFLEVIKSILRCLKK